MADGNVAAVLVQRVVGRGGGAVGGALIVDILKLQFVVFQHILFVHHGHGTGDGRLVLIIELRALAGHGAHDGHLHQLLFAGSGSGAGRGSRGGRGGGAAGATAGGQGAGSGQNACNSQEFATGNLFHQGSLLLFSTFFPVGTYRLRASEWLRLSLTTSYVSCRMQYNTFDMRCQLCILIFVLMPISGRGFLAIFPVFYPFLTDARSCTARIRKGRAHGPAFFLFCSPLFRSCRRCSPARPGGSGSNPR